MKIQRVCSFNQGRKCLKGIDRIFYGEISIRRYFGINLEKSAIFSNISHGQHEPAEVKRATVKSMWYSVNAPPILLPRGFEPQTKRFGVIQKV